MRRWLGFLVCLVVSASIWTLSNLSKTYSGILTVTVIAKTNLDGYSETSAEPVMLTARCLTDGFSLWWNHLESNSKPITVEIQARDFSHVGGDTFHITGTSLSKYIPNIFGDDVQLEAFMSDVYTFRFNVENCKKVPVKALSVVEYRPQYMAKKEIKVTPDSVLVYGNADRLEGIDQVYTKALKIKDLHHDVNGVLKLEPLTGVRVSSEEVAYSIDVTRYVEMTDDVNVITIMVPSGHNFTVMPSTVKVTYRCQFPIIVDPVGKTNFYVDYNDFKQSLTGKCIVRHERLPDGVIDCIIEPEVCECIEYR